MLKSALDDETQDFASKYAPALIEVYAAASTLMDLAHFGYVDAAVAAEDVLDAALAKVNTLLSSP